MIVQLLNVPSQFSTCDVEGAPAGKEIAGSAFREVQACQVVSSVVDAVISMNGQVTIAVMPLKVLLKFVHCDVSMAGKDVT